MKPSTVTYQRPARTSRKSVSRETRWRSLRFEALALRLARSAAAGVAVRGPLRPADFLRAMRTLKVPRSSAGYSIEILRSPLPRMSLNSSSRTATAPRAGSARICESGRPAFASQRSMVGTGLARSWFHSWRARAAMCCWISVTRCAQLAPSRRAASITCVSASPVASARPGGGSSPARFMGWVVGKGVSAVSRASLAS